MEYEIFHLGELVQMQAKRFGNRTAMRHRDDQSGQWLPISWQQFALRVEQTACAMLANNVGVQEKIGVFSQNMPEGLYTDFAAFSIRAITVPLYATSSEAQVQYIVDDAQIRIMFVGEQQQYDVATRVMPLCSTLERIVIYDDKVKRNPQDVASVYFSDFVKDVITDGRKACLSEMRRQLTPEDIANILYTSGTTGEPKGVMLHHSNYNAQWKVHMDVLPQLHLPNQVSMNFLPLTHVFERAWTFLCFESGIEVCINTDPHVISRSLQEIHPTMMCSVPRFWEKVFDGVQAKIAAMSPIMQSVVRNALEVGRQYNVYYVMKQKSAPLGLSLRYKLYNKLIFQTLKRAIGLERGTLFPTAGASIPEAVEEFTHSCGIPMVAGYGLTESTATVSCDQGRTTIGSIGRPLPGIKVKISENNEILVKAPSITSGYYKKESATKEAFDADGYFHTGDAGYIKNGELYITDRIKDLFKTSNGKYIAPQALEGKLCVDKYIDQIAIIADRRKFVSALIVPNYEELKKYAVKAGISYQTVEDLVSNDQIYKMMQTRIDTLQQSLASYEKVKRFTLLPKPFSMDRGELTNTLKIRRAVLNANFAEEIEKMYEE
ncbi:MAG: long-chain fatty acid--CoA ligase [Bacteroidaceae bacterium]|nr:long-chain fatty acid--CoA ligase [Bacteroidaceae bacterium]